VSDVDAIEMRTATPPARGYSVLVSETLSQPSHRTAPSAPAATAEHPIILFDGVCNLCNGLVRFVIRRDPNGRFHFASLQSDAGRALLAAHGLTDHGLDSMALVENGRAHVRSDAALRVVRGLSGLWPVFGVALILPRFIRDAVYEFIAKRRYRWFGKRDQCMVPTPEQAARFVA
jgi:predicted DCC family thiol-disulfide oxidoreductase YuxK